MGALFGASEVKSLVVPMHGTWHLGMKQAIHGVSDFTEGAMNGHVIRLSGFMVMGFLAMTIVQLIEAVYFIDTRRT